MSSLIINANALFIPLANKSVHTIVTSPPYYGLRDYGTATWQGGDVECEHKQYLGGHNPEVSPKQLSSQGTQQYNYRNKCGKCGAIRIDEQIGLEVTPDAYIANLVEVFRECKRILRDDGTLWVNIGDSYASNGEVGQTDEVTQWKHGTLENEKRSRARGAGNGIKPKDLIGIPWMLAFALRADGWYLRQDIIWAKPNPMPESVKDRCTKSHEYIFLLSKSAKYYYDNEAVMEVATGYDGRKDTLMKGSAKYANGFVPSEPAQTMAVKGHERWRYKNLQPDGQQPNTMHLNRLEGEEYMSPVRNKCDVWTAEADFFKMARNGTNIKGHSGYYNIDGELIGQTDRNGMPVRNKRDVWTVTTKPYKGAHYATFNPELIKPCILAGAPEGGIVFDPFVGSGTTVATAIQLGRKGIGLDLSLKYLRENARERIYEQEMQPVISF